jgi:hypothetical protein
MRADEVLRVGLCGWWARLATYNVRLNPCRRPCIDTFLISSLHIIVLRMGMFAVEE